MEPALSLSTNVAARCRLRSANSRTLQLPSTRRTTLGDRAFSVAAARAWNSLPPEIRNSDSLLTFRRMTKTYLFQLSFANWTLLIGTLHFCNCVKCPSSMCLAMCHINQYFCNNKNNRWCAIEIYTMTSTMRKDRQQQKRTLRSRTISVAKVGTTKSSATPIRAIITSVPK